MMAPLRPAELIERQIEQAQLEFVRLVDHNPQFALSFFNAFLRIHDWERTKALLDIEELEEGDTYELAFARLAGRKEIVNELAEIRDRLIEAALEDEEEEPDDAS